MQKKPHSYICTEKGAIIKNIPIKKKLHVEQRKIIKIKKYQLHPHSRTYNASINPN